jgi:hypothetical protein
MLFETLSIVDRAYLIYDSRVKRKLKEEDFLVNDPISASYHSRRRGGSEAAAQCATVILSRRRILDM